MTPQASRSSGTIHPEVRGRILIVEDQGVVATDIERCLEEGGFQVTGIAPSMKDAIREARALRPDLVLMDIRIKGDADGIQAADYLHREFDIPIVFLTAHDDRDTMERAKLAEPMAFLLKPFKPAELTSTVEIALNRSRIDRQVRERERSFLSAMDAIGDGVLTTDAAGRIRFMNLAAQNLTGWSQEHALGRLALDVIHILEGQDAASAHLRALLEVDNAPESDQEFRVISRKGDCHWLTFRSMTIPGYDPVSIRVLVMRDVSRLKESEQTLRRQADLLDQCHEAILTWTVDGTLHFWNHGAQKLYGYESAEVLGQNVESLLPALNRSPAGTWREALERSGRWSGELTRRTKDGREIVVEAVLVAVEEGSGGTIVLETDHDITGRKHSEREILHLNRELQARVNDLVQLNRELESFNYSISHDLRAPLRHINGFARILLQDAEAGLTAESRGSLEHVREAAQKMGLMVDALLELSRTSRKAPRRFSADLAEMVRELASDFAGETGGREVEWRIGGLPVVNCDPVLVRQVLANLVGNALKFTRRRSPAVIEVGHSVSSAGEIVLFVKDNGVGFNMKYAGQLFGVFQRLHRAEDYEGTGIGLAIVQKIVQKHGGRIWTESEVDKGAAFFFTLEPPAPKPERELESSESHG